MAGGRIRTIKPEWLEDERLAAASNAARVLSIALLLLADDHGCGRAHPAYLASQAWAYGDPLETLRMASAAIAELAAIRFVELYDVGGQRYFHVRNWEKHQKVQHAGNRRVPAPSDGSTVPHESLTKVPENPPEGLTPDLDLGSGSPTTTTTTDTPAPAGPGPSPGTPPPAEVGPLFGAMPADPTPEPPAPKAPGPAERVFAVYLEGWRRVVHGTRPPALDTKRRKLVEARGRDFPLEELELAARGIWLSRWHLEAPGSRITFEIAMRDTAHVERFRDVALHGDTGGPSRSNGAALNVQPVPATGRLWTPGGEP